MKEFVDEVIRRFPEIQEKLFEGDRGQPYVVLRDLVDWLAKEDGKPLQGNVVTRVVDFYKWAMLQPRGETSKNDISTFMIVGFVEDLVKHDKLLPLIPRIMSREELLEIGDLIRHREGEGRFDQILMLFRKSP